MDEPKISVVMPVRNAEQYIEQALKGLENLHFDSWELLIVDDGSTDGTALALNRWLQVTPVDSTLISHETSRGVAAARNAAVDQAKGQFIWFVDGDDSWAADILRHLWSGVSDGTVDIVACDAERVVAKTGHVSAIQDAPHEEIIGGFEALQRILSGEIQGHLWNKIIRTRLLQRHPFPEMRSHSDLAGLIRLTAESRQVAMIPGAKYYYNVHEGSILQSSDYKWETLIACSEIAEATLAHKKWKGRLQRDLALFKASHVMVPAANSISLNKSWEPDKIPYRDCMTLSLLFSSLTRGQGLLAAKSLAIRHAPRMYAAIYRRHHVKKWGSE
ncbi:glycosyltransferase family 2 protein [Kocuria sp. CH-021]|uniref:glycosyltransferase family 2 protein n=1 Tax=Kocuria sp. CH-021 TaxID=3406735 RepID=UPI003C7174AC